MLFNPSRPRTRAKRLSSTNLILIGGEILRGLSFCLVVVLLASAIALTGTSSGIGASSNHLSPAASLHRIAPTTVYPFLPNFKVTDGSSPYKYQVEPTMVINRSGTAFAVWKETDGPDAAGFRVGSSYSTDQGQTWAPNILMNQTHPNLGCRDSDPWMARDPSDRVHFAYLEYDPGGGSARSEEHTSELQSQFHLVCRLLLEKKKGTRYSKRFIG